jgi:hypothetical protein
MQILSIVDPAYHTLQKICNFVVKWAKMLVIFFRQFLYDTAYDYSFQYVVSYVKFLEDFAQTKYCSSNEKNKYKFL